MVVDFPSEILRRAKADTAPPPPVLHQQSTLGAVETFTQDVLRELATQPELMHTLSPHSFEQLIARILADMGYQVCLTPQTRDGGRDILAILNAPLGPTLTIVECKRFAPDRPIGIDIVERFLWVVEHNDRASGGLIATTSYFSKPALQIANELEYRLLLKDFGAISKWLAHYGNWTVEGSARVWLPFVR